MVTLPSWWRRPGESWLDWDRRLERERVAHHERQKAEARAAPPPSADGLAIDLACGVGTYDGNGNPKGAGW